MPSHWLIRDDKKSNAEWLLEWDDSTFLLKEPGGETVFEVETARAHRLIDPFQLYSNRKIGFREPFDSLVFKNSRAVADLAELVETGLKSDPGYRYALRRHSLQVAASGMAMSLFAGGLFGLFCWFASW